MPAKRRKRSRRQVNQQRHRWSRRFAQGAAAGVLTTLSGAALAWSAYSVLWRDPQNSWFVDIVKKFGHRRDSITMWIPGVSSKEDYKKDISSILELKSRDTSRCPVAFFPYGSTTTALDILGAGIDMHIARSNRTQVLNMQLALVTFVRSFKQVHLVCHSHGALIVRRALESLGLDHPSISVQAFGPAALIPVKNSRFSVGRAINWINKEDILLSLRILKVPPEVAFRDRLQRVKYGLDELEIISRQSRDIAQMRQWQQKPLSPGMMPYGFFAHRCYPFFAGVVCSSRPVKLPVYENGTFSADVIHGDSGSDVN